MTISINRLGNLPIGRLASNSQEIELTLVPDQVLAMNGDKRGLEVSCQRGRLWITQANDEQDHLLNSGEKFVISRSGTVVIQGTRQGKLRITPPK